MIITLGFTESDRAADYSSFSDGYRIGARQESVTVVLDGSGEAMTAKQWAEAAYEASNLRDAAPAGPAQTIHLALTTQVRGPLRSLSRGDTVTVHGQMLACEALDWRRVDEAVTGGSR